MALDFQNILKDTVFPDFVQEERLAIAVSGGPDSMALADMMGAWSEKYKGPELHILTVDHGLRPEAAEEAHAVGEWGRGWKKAVHQTLKWNDAKPDSCIQEEARKARYSLMEEYCRAEGIQYLFLAHHQDDQAETFLFRLAKGSGLDGLSCMKPLQAYESIQLVRPLLGIRKADLVLYCDKRNIPYHIDPSNESDEFARVRLRGVMDALEQEGLTVERLSGTAKRMLRAQEALDYYAIKAFESALLKLNSMRIVLNFGVLLKYPDEIIFRVVNSVIRQLGHRNDYGPRMTKVENLVSDLVYESPFRKRTLGGVVIECDDQNKEIIFQKEHG